MWSCCLLVKDLCERLRNFSDRFSTLPFPTWVLKAASLMRPRLLHSNRWAWSILFIRESFYITTWSLSLENAIHFKTSPGMIKNSSSTKQLLLGISQQTWGISSQGCPVAMDHHFQPLVDTKFFQLKEKLRKVNSTDFTGVLFILHTH